LLYHQLQDKLTNLLIIAETNGRWLKPVSLVN
jgi:hypothetical protein